MLLYIQSYHSWKIVVKNVYRLWVALASSVFLLLTTLFSKISREEEFVLVERIFVLITCSLKVQPIKTLATGSFKVRLRKCFTKL